TSTLTSSAWPTGGRSAPSSCGSSPPIADPPSSAREAVPAPPPAAAVHRRTVSPPTANQANALSRRRGFDGADPGERAVELRDRFELQVRGDRPIRLARRQRRVGGPLRDPGRPPAGRPGTRDVRRPVVADVEDRRR